MQTFTILNAISTLVILAVSAKASRVEAYVPAGGLNELAKLMPASTLPSPDGLDLKYVLLGIGTQNYTCMSGDESDVPGTVGAVARLYDIGTSLKGNHLANWTINLISPLIHSLSSQPEQLDRMLYCQGFQYLVGHHFFDLDTPVFALDRLSQAPYPVAMVRKLAETDAPTSSCPATQTGDNIKWLFLKDVKGISRGGVDTVYRVETAGGNKPTTCKGQKPNFEVHYVAQYWIFGPEESG